jgi:hypothetical protein
MSSGSKPTRREVEALAIVSWLARHGLEEAETGAYFGAHYQPVPIPPEARCGRKRAIVLVRKVEPVRKAS